MARLTESILVQWIDGEGAVFLDQSDGSEVLVPREDVPTVIVLLQQFMVQDG